jgi:hypothetical protein
MPQTLHFEDPAAFQRAMSVYSKHSDLHVVLGDRESYEMVCERLPRQRVYLCLDAAYFMIDVIPAVMQRLKSSADERTLYLIRRDKERKARGGLPAAASIVDWYVGEAIDVHDEALRAFAELGLEEILNTADDRVSWRHFYHGCALLSGAKTIVTDRLHAHILSTMLGKANVLWDNSYGKNSRFFRTWRKHIPRFAQLALEERGLEATTAGSEWRSIGFLRGDGMHLAPSDEVSRCEAEASRTRRTAAHEVAEAIIGGRLPQAPQATLYSVDVLSHAGVDTLVSGTNAPFSVKRGDAVQITGWAIDLAAKAEAGGVVALVDGASAVRAKYGISRPDVAQALGSLAYEMSGFEVTIDTAGLTAARHQISFAILDRGSRACYPVKSVIDISVH